MTGVVGKEETTQGWIDGVTEVGRKGTQWGEGEVGERIGGEAGPTWADLITGGCLSMEQH